MLLTWLCVLSFVFGAAQLSLGVLNAFTSFPQWMLSTTKAEYERKKEEMGPEALAANRWYIATQDASIAGQERNLASARSRGYLSIGGSCLSLLGVWLMWNLRKTGFWLYSIASIGSWSGTRLLALDNNPLITLNMWIYAAIGVGFIILYGSHLKHMR